MVSAGFGSAIFVFSPKNEPSAVPMGATVCFYPLQVLVALFVTSQNSDYDANAEIGNEASRITNPILQTITKSKRSWDRVDERGIEAITKSPRIDYSTGRSLWRAN